MTERRSDGVSGNGGSGGNIGGRFGRDGMRFGLNGKELQWNMVHDKDVLMAQTTQFASFGPVLLVTTFPEPLLSSNVIIVTVNIV